MLPHSLNGKTPPPPSVKSASQLPPAAAPPMQSVRTLVKEYKKKIKIKTKISSALASGGGENTVFESRCQRQSGSGGGVQVINSSDRWDSQHRNTSPQQTALLLQSSVSSIDHISHSLPLDRATKEWEWKLPVRVWVHYFPAPENVSACLPVCLSTSNPTLEKDWSSKKRQCPFSLF